MSTVKTIYWHKLNDNQVQCDLCPRECKLSEGQRGFCFVRGCEEGEIVLHAYGRSSGLQVDPIEKKPLYHFYPGSKVLSFGTVGCNLGCLFCQNWDLSKSKVMDRMQSDTSPSDIIKMALKSDSKSIAFTYNDPIIFLEFAKDVALLARKENLKTVAVTSGYISERPREDFFNFIDAANVDLKGFSEDFYKNLTGGHLAPVLETLKYIRHKTSTWLEITTLLIPGKNDSEDEISEMTKWISKNLGNDVPLHFSAFHPSYKITDIPRTSFEILNRAREIALSNNLQFVYTGNVHDKVGSSTNCPNCQQILIERDWFTIGDYNLDQNGRCLKCLEVVPGYFLEEKSSFSG